MAPRVSAECLRLSYDGNIHQISIRARAPKGSNAAACQQSRYTLMPRKRSKSRLEDPIFSSWDAFRDRLFTLSICVYLSFLNFLLYFKYRDQISSYCKDLHLAQQLLVQHTTHAQLRVCCNSSSVSVSGPPVFLPLNQRDYHLLVYLAALSPVNKVPLLNRRGVRVWESVRCGSVYRGLSG